MARMPVDTLCRRYVSISGICHFLMNDELMFVQQFEKFYHAKQTHIDLSLILSGTITNQDHVRDSQDGALLPH